MIGAALGQDALPLAAPSAVPAFATTSAAAGRACVFTATLRTALLLARAAGRLGRGGGGVIESVEAFARDAAADEALEGTQVAVFVGADEAERVAHHVGAASAADAVD